MKRGTREWIQKAENDYDLAVQTAAGPKPFHDHVCFLCQQSAEKYLKALLMQTNVAIPRTHNLDDLLSLILPHHANLRRLRRGLIFLSDFAVEFRYPGVSARKRQAQAALKWAANVRHTCRDALGV